MPDSRICLLNLLIRFVLLSLLFFTTSTLVVMIPEYIALDRRSLAFSAVPLFFLQKFDEVFYFDGLLGM